MCLHSTSLRNSLALGSRTPLLSIQLSAADAEDAEADSCAAEISIIIGYRRYFCPGLSCYNQSLFVRTSGFHYYPQFSTQRSEIAIFWSRMNIHHFLCFRLHRAPLQHMFLQSFPNKCVDIINYTKLRPVFLLLFSPALLPLVDRDSMSSSLRTQQIEDCDIWPRMITVCA
jgi:hypothetical protein